MVAYHHPFLFFSEDLSESDVLTFPMCPSGSHRFAGALSLFCRTFSLQAFRAKGPPLPWRFLWLDSEWVIWPISLKFFLVPLLGRLLCEQSIFPFFPSQNRRYCRGYSPPLMDATDCPRRILSSGVLFGLPSLFLFLLFVNAPSKSNGLTSLALRYLLVI